MYYKDKTHEYFVSFETANLLKQIGFDWMCNDGYLLTSGLFTSGQFVNKDDELSVAAPSLDVVQRWLREVKGYNVESYLYFGLREVRNAKDDKYTASTTSPSDMSQEEIHDISKIFDSYEDALEYAIKECLTILLNKKENNDGEENY